MATRVALMLLGGVLALGAAGCGGETIDSTWRTSEIHIDGKANDWSQAAFLEKDGLEWAVLNDDTHLYACLITRTATVRNQIMLQGLTVWFDPEGGDDKVFGIRFPLGLADSEESMSAMRRMRQNGQEDRARVMAEFEQSLTKLEMRQGEGEVDRLAIESSHGVEVRMGVSLSNSLIYEIKLPLVASGGVTYAVGAAPGARIGVGLDSPELDREVIAERMGRGGDWQAKGTRGAGGGGRGGGRGGGGRAGRGGARPEIPEPLDAWGRLKLAVRPQT